MPFMRVAVAGYPFYLGESMIGRLCMGIRIGIAVTKRLKAHQDRKELMESLLVAFGDGKITENEWVIVGGKLGVFDVED